MAVLLIMAAQQGMPNNVNNNAITRHQQQQHQHHHEHQLVKPIFHDFLGMKPSDSSPSVLVPKTTTTPDVRLSEASPSSASASLGASSGGGRGPISTTSDLASGESLPHFRL